MSERSERPSDSGESLAELDALSARIIEQAQPGEQLEAYVARGGETSIRVYEGNIEKFESAQSEGVGVRIIRDGRTGFAYAGTLDPAAIDEVVAEARDNVVFGTVDEWAGLAEPDGVAVTDQELWNEALAGYATDRKIELAMELERQALAADPRIRVDDANYADSWGEHAVATTHRHPTERPGERVLRQHLDARRRERRDPDRLRVQRRPSARRARRRASPPPTA